MNLVQKIQKNIKSAFNQKTKIEVRTVYSSHQKAKAPRVLDLHDYQSYHICQNAFNSILNLVFQEDVVIKGKYKGVMQSLYDKHKLENLLKEALYELVLGSGNALVFYRNGEPFLYPFYQDNKLQVHTYIDRLTNKVESFGGVNSSFKLKPNQTYHLKKGYGLIGQSPLIIARPFIDLAYSEIDSAKEIADGGHRDAFIIATPMLAKGTEQEQIFYEAVKESNKTVAYNLNENGGAGIITGVESFHAVKRHQFKYRETLDSINAQVAISFGLSPSYLGIGNSANFKNEQDRENTLETNIKEYQDTLKSLLHDVMSKLSPLFKTLHENHEIEISFGDPATKSLEKEKDQTISMLQELYLPNQEYFNQRGYTVGESALEMIGLIKKDTS